MPEDHQQTLESLRRRNTELESALREALHDLRTPLMTIQGFSQELAISTKELSGVQPVAAVDDQRLREIVTDEVPEAIQYILEAASKLQAVIDRLSRIL
jgi:signal transduction histidine kinase